MSDFINTIDVLGDDVVIDSIIDRSITEFKDNVITKIGGYAFSGCTALETVDLPNVTLLGSNCFVDCTALTMLEFPNIAGELLQYSYLIGNCGGGDGLGNNPSKTYLKLPRVTKMGAYAIVKFSPMVAEFSLPVTFSASAFGYGCCGYLVLRGETLSTASGSPFSGGIRNDILVPRSLIDSYKVATNWSNYADQFKAIEDYTVDGTTTGEFVRCSGITLDQTSLTFDELATQSLTATALTPSPLGWDIVVWKSGDSSIAAVVDGRVSPRGKGTTTITAACNGYSASCEVVVNTDGMNVLLGVAFNAGYINNNGSITAGGTTDVYTDKFDIAVLSGSTIIVNLLDVKSTATFNRIMYYSESGAVVGYTEGSVGTNGVVITSTVPDNATLAALSINKSSGFSGIEITSDGELVGSLGYTA